MLEGNNRVLPDVGLLTQRRNGAKEENRGGFRCAVAPLREKCLI